MRKVSWLSTKTLKQESLVLQNQLIPRQGIKFQRITLLSFLSTMQANLSSSTDMLRKLLQSKRRSKSRDSDASCDTEVSPPKRLKPNSDSQEFGLSETMSEKVKERVSEKANKRASEKAVNERA